MSLAEQHAIQATSLGRHPALSIELSDGARQLLAGSLAANSQRAYRSDLQRLQAAGLPWPCTPEQIANYLAENSDTLAVATLQRHLASLAKVHRAMGANDPTKSEVVKATLRGIRRSIGSAQTQAKPLLKDDLDAVCACIGQRPRDIRDRAILLLGFAGAFRRSELVSVDYGDLDEVRQGIVITLDKSKTDQFGEGRKVAIPWGRTSLCPVQSLKAWLTVSGIKEGPIFRPVDRNSQILPMRLSGEAVASIVRERCASAGLSAAKYTGHSLRAGLATSAAMAGALSHKIRQQTGHASEAMLSRYIRDGELWNGNAAGSVL